MKQNMPLLLLLMSTTLISEGRATADTVSKLTPAQCVVNIQPDGMVIDRCAVELNVINGSGEALGKASVIFNPTPAGRDRLAANMPTDNTSQLPSLTSTPFVAALPPAVGAPVWAIPDSSLGAPPQLPSPLAPGAVGDPGVGPPALAAPLLPPPSWASSDANLGVPPPSPSPLAPGAPIAPPMLAPSGAGGDPGVVAPASLAASPLPPSAWTNTDGSSDLGGMTSPQADGGEGSPSVLAPATAEGLVAPPAGEPVGLISSPVPAPPPPALTQVEGAPAPIPVAESLAAPSPALLAPQLGATEPPVENSAEPLKPVQTIALPSPNLVAAAAKLATAPGGPAATSAISEDTTNREAASPNNQKKGPSTLERIASNVLNAAADQIEGKGNPRPN